MFRVFRALMVMFITMSGLVGTAAAQSTTAAAEFTSELTGSVISLGDGGTFVEADHQVIEEGGVTTEYIIVSGGGSEYELALVQGDNTADQYLNGTLATYQEFYDSIVVVTSDATASPGWFVADADSSVLYAAYEVDALGDVDLGIVQFSTADTLESGVTWAQENIMIDGAPILDGVVAADVLAAYQGTEQTVAETATAETTSGRTRRDASTTTTTTTTTATEAAEPTAATANTGAAPEFTSEVSGDVISLGTDGTTTFMDDRYELNETVSFSEEYIWYTNTYANYQLVFVAGETTPAEYTEVTNANMVEFYDTWEILDSGETDTNAWFLGFAELNGNPIVVFYDYELDASGDVDRVYMQFTVPESFQPALEWSQGNLTIGGESLLGSHDAPALSQLLPGMSNTSNTTTGTDSSDTSNTTTAADSSDTSNPSNTSDGEDAADSTSATPAAPGDWTSMGLVSDTEWVSPHYGHTVTWEPSTWEFPHDYEYAVIINNEREYDTITLQTVDGMGYVYLTIDSTNELTSEDLVEWYMSPEYAESIRNPIEIVDSHVTATTGGIVYVSTNSLDQPIMVVIDVQILDDGTAIYTQLTAAPEQLPGVLEKYSSDVYVNGVVIEQTFTPEDIEALNEN